ncbi:GNAT family N-acetyltransferase [Caulobacter sp. NIBR2454]|uniref:GNAT family N-acetyltransferase n=1 Tax=Caulobacter sp. NIBR2454 TaxID=3015996 RepID=UPI0022B7118D|nr:GNAT family N-acetyltransferase [Caulobacter sp. NIBR2454]
MTSPISPLKLVTPSAEYLPGYVDALERGWSPDNLRGAAAATEQLTAIATDAPRFLDSLYDPQAKGAPIKLADGGTVPRLPGYFLWLWDGEFCGSISFRWSPGTSTLPSHVLGHIGYGVVPWKAGRGYATRALGLLLPRCRAEGLDYVELTVQPDNLASQRVITANGGRFVERFQKVDAHGGQESLRFRIEL